MRLLDANILMYASFDAYPQHRKAKAWLDIGGSTNLAKARRLTME